MENEVDYLNPEKIREDLVVRRQQDLQSTIISLVVLVIVSIIFWSTGGGWGAWITTGLAGFFALGVYGNTIPVSSVDVANEIILRDAEIKARKGL